MSSTRTLIPMVRNADYPVFDDTGPGAWAKAMDITFAANQCLRTALEVIMPGIEILKTYFLNTLRNLRNVITRYRKCGNATLMDSNESRVQLKLTSQTRLNKVNL
ncbi:1411_t:CDS:2 [Paraglomus occultum]|uniref:1411_t:CDS:1 n=1 Tax=Paraglomus occultum TaxID=144539 RepID=A0A9N9A1V7_9GLOM|nr:1411_t:CDS:2 [Paraglomus occultum]